MNIAQALKLAEDSLRKNSIESPCLDVQVLLAHCLERPKHHLFSHPEYMLSDEERRRFFQLIERRGRKEPVAYITGQKEFWSRTFTCSKHTLIPRPETELVVETAMEFFDAKPSPPEYILDLGTGTGCIGITLAAHWMGAAVLLTDIDFNALMVARQNLERLLPDAARIHIVCSDWFDGLSEACKFDIVTANPPYISRQEASLLSEDVIGFEPERALFSDGEGMSEIKKIFSQASRYLRPGGLVISEIGWMQGEDVSRFIKNLDIYKEVFIARDLSGNDRVVAASI